MRKAFGRLFVFACVVSLLLAGRASAAPAVPGNVWDISKITVTGGSPTDDFFNPHQANLENMFEPKVNVNRPFEDDTVNTLFGDRQPAGFVHFVEWQTAAPVTLGSFKLHAVDDRPTFNRSFDSFTLYAFEGGVYKPIFSSPTTHPYTYDNLDQLLLFDRAVTTLINTDRFRAEFTQNGTIGNGYLGQTTYGPRVLELDGFAAAPVPPDQVPLPPGVLAGMMGAGIAGVVRRRWKTKGAARSKRI
jgi:hypothetical protein